ncbi:MAG: F0F1 ATP synthase subunit gamma [Candidatus Levybacteria bacterium]|nr:F0F1 ATP synthase subunit gamma [Candidatus Levybacteria bacterium]
MNYIKNILTQIEDLSGIKDIVGASEEIASMKMRAIRGQVLESRDLNEELTEIYREVTTSYKEQVMNIVAKKQNKSVAELAKQAQTSLLRGNGQTACVFLSANSGFFSKILEKTYKEFAIYLDSHNAKPIIIGEFGRKLFTDQFPGREFNFYAFSEKQNNDDALQKVTKDLVSYENVIIFYPRFESLSSQTVAALDVSGSSKDASGTVVPKAHYLFEPSLEKILAFFEGEIFAGIIHQTVTESELARYASRITALDIARENINVKLKAVNLEKRFATHRLMNKKQTEALMGISLWKLA